MSLTISSNKPLLCTLTVIALLLIVPLNSGAYMTDIITPVNSAGSEMDEINNLDFNTETEISNELKSTIDQTMSGFAGFRENPDSNSEVKFILSSSQMHIGFSESKVQLRIPNFDEEHEIVSAEPLERPDKMRFKNIGYTDVSLEFLGSNFVVPIAEGPSSTYFNYFYGSDSEKWVTNASGYGKVVYKNIYDNIDLVYSMKNGQLKYDFYVYPGGNYGEIQLKWNGPVSLEQTGDGLNIAVETASGEISLIDTNPINFLGAEHVEVAGSFNLINYETYGFSIQDYDQSKLLIIDPVFDLSTYIGTTSPDMGYSMALDNDGNIYITGATQSPFFPMVSGGYQEEKEMNYDVFVTKLSANGSTLICSTYLGGGSPYEFGGADLGTAIIVDDEGNIYITGGTDSHYFPTTPGAYDEVGHLSEANGWDAFVSKISSDCSKLIFSTYLDGSFNERGNSLALDVDDNVYVTGYTYSSDFPVTSGVFQKTHGGLGVVFISKLSADGSSLLHSTFIGRGTVSSISVDPNGDIYIAGEATSDTFPITPDAYNKTFDGGRDIFLTKLAANFSTLLYSTFIGGSSIDYCNSMVIHYTRTLFKVKEATIFITGYTLSPNFPTTKDAYDETYNGGEDIIVIKFDVNRGNFNLRYSTFIGDANDDTGESIAFDNNDNVYITGSTTSTDFPTTTGAYDESYNGGRDAFVTYLSSNGSNMLYSTFIGGGGGDSGRSIVLDHNEVIHLSGYTFSADFPTTPGAYDESYNAGEDVFVIKLTLKPYSPINIYSTIGSNNEILSLFWDEPETHGGSFITEYRVYRGTSSGSYSLLGTISQTAFNDTTVSMNQDYYYVVTAVNTFGESPFSSEHYVYIQAPITPPINFTATAGAGHVHLIWDPPLEDGGTPIIRYNLYRGDSSQNYNLVMFVTGTEYNDTYVDGGTTYYYVVGAINEDGERMYTDEISATPSAGLPSGDLITITVISTTTQVSTTTNENSKLTGSQVVFTLLAFTAIIGSRIIRSKKRTKI